jgi:N-acetylglutamate synthase-like GNAT family acetyltransferase
MNRVIRCARTEDTQRLVEFLEQAQVRTNGVEETIDCFLIMEDESGNMKATIGMEPLDHAGLLRSLVMSSQATEQDLFLLLEQMLLLAKEKRIIELFLATNKRGARRLVEHLGFKKVDKEQLPKVLFRSEHVQHLLTVDNSVFLELSV